MFVRFVSYGGLTGISISIVLYPLIYWATAHPYSGLGHAVYAVLPYLWPSSPLMMFVEARPTMIAFSAAIVALAILTNGMVYAGAAGIIWASLRLVSLVRRTTSQS